MNYQIVIQTAFIGDVFLSVPFLQRLKATYPQDKILLVAKKNVAQFLKISGYIDDLIEIEKGQRDSYKLALNKINTLKVENVFCLHRSLRSSLFSLQITAQKKVGYTNWINRFIMSKTIEYPVKYPDAIRQMSLLGLVNPDFKIELNKTDWSLFNVKNTNNTFMPIPQGFAYEFNQDVNLDTRLKNLLSPRDSRKRVALFPGSVWETKKWPLGHYALLAEQLLTQYDVYVMGGPDEAALANELQKKVPQVIVLAGKLKLTESIQILTQFDVIICNDSSPSHMASLLNKPVISIFGPTTLSLGFRPWGNQVKVIENNQLDCRPCGLHGHKQCPLGHHKCMVDIPVSAVFEAAQSFLN